MPEKEQDQDQNALERATYVPPEIFELGPADELTMGNNGLTTETPSGTGHAPSLVC